MAYRRLVAAASVLVVLPMAPGAFAQVITVTGQSRFISGTTTSMDPAGTIVVGPDRVDAPAGDFGFWNGSLTEPGFIATDGLQQGGFNGSDTISLDIWTMNFSGGGGPDTSGSATLENHFEYTFDVPRASTYTLNGFFGSSLPVLVTFDLSGPGVSIHDDDSDGDVVQYDNVTGVIGPGTYTLSLVGEGTISYTGPGGNGGGAGGQQPLLTFTVTPGGSACGSADFNCDGDIGTDSDIESFFACLAGSCPSAPCTSTADFNGDGDTGTDADIEAFFRVLAGGEC